MIDISIYTEKLDIALRQKSNASYRKKIASELAKPEWQQQVFELESTFNKVKDEQDFQKYQNTLTKLFDDIYEVITAPGVDDFIGWMNELTNDKNNTNAKKLRNYLVEHYSETSISESIEIIISSKQVLEIENSIFTSLLSEVAKELKKKTTTFLNDPKQFENNIDDYFDLVKSTLDGLREIKELYYTKPNELFSNEQIDNNIDFYIDIVSLVIEKNQSTKPINDTDNNLGLIDKIKNRISDINKCIVLLYKTKIANSQDTTFQKLFLKFTEDMVKYEGGVKNNLEEFIENKWIELETKYNTINDFFENKQTISYDSRWDSYPSKDELQSIILQYNSLIKDNILDTVLTKSVLSIQQSLTSKAKAINDFESYSATVSNNILLVFKCSLSEYESKNLALLDSLAISKPSINSIIIEIKESLEGLKNGIKSLENATDLISYLNEDFLIDLNTNNDITALFRKALNESGMSDHLNWLESKLNGADNGIVSSQDFGNSNLIKELLDKGLIKIEIQKTF